MQNPTVTLTGTKDGRANFNFLIFVEKKAGSFKITEKITSHARNSKNPRKF